MKKAKICNNKILQLILIVIIVVGLVITATIGLNVSLIYMKNTTINIKLDTSFENSDIKNIAKEVYQDQKVLVQKVEIYEDMVAVTVQHTTDEQKQELLNKVNAFYGLEKSIEEDVTVENNSNVRLRSVLEECISTLAISFILVMIYIAIRYRKNNVIDIITKSSVKIVEIQFLLLSIIAITRLPVNRLTVPTVLFVYGVSVYWVISRLEKKFK
ncbi:MAG: hypothetical protein Q4G05_00815 [Clostridia bacterium]|nr:hypothetical protein [Clostridia bacterium]